MRYEYELIRSDRKTLSLEISSDCRIIVRAPRYISDGEIEEFICSHDSWIDKHLKAARERASTAKSYSPEEIYALRMAAERIIPQKVKKYSEIMGLYPTGIKITSAKKALRKLQRQKLAVFFALSYGLRRGFHRPRYSSRAGAHKTQKPRRTVSCARGEIQSLQWEKVGFLSFSFFIFS